MLTKLIVFRESLRKIYARAGLYIRHILTFVLAFFSMLIIEKSISTKSIIANPLMCFVLALISAFFPINVAVIVTTIYMIILLFGMSVELAIIAVFVILIVYLLYFRFSPRTGFVILLAPLLFFMKIPYLIPVVVALTVGMEGIVPTVSGVFIYYLIDFASSYSNAITTLDADNALQNITFIFNNILTNKELVVVEVSFAVAITFIFFVRRLSVNHAWTIAILAGTALDAIIQVIAFAVIGVEYNVVMMIVGHILAIAVGFILHFFVFCVDYSATEILQFEDDDYYYYVKAVPKITIASKDVKVKKINERQETGTVVYTENYEDSDENL